MTREAIRVILFNDLPVLERKESLMADPTMPALPAVRNQLLSEPDLLRSLVIATVWNPAGTVATSGGLVNESMSEACLTT